MDYSQTLDYIDSFINFEKIPRYSYTSSFKLERMHSFLHELGNPHHGLNTIHVAGSKGKGSTCAIIGAILKQAGYCVGLYTSPHLLDIRERIRVLGPGPRVSDRGRKDFEGMIEREKFIRLVGKIKSTAERFRDHKGLGRLSFFEILTACAFLYFKEKKVDFAVLETGLGGRLDATNVTMPMVCAITNISMEHMDKLGHSLRLIAKEKIGIVKASVPVVSAPQKKEAMDVIRKRCKQKGATFYEIGKDITFSVIDSNEDGQSFNLDGPDYSYKGLKINLLGHHQIENAGLAIGAVKCIDNERCTIDEKGLRSSLGRISWPGRIQIIQRRPYVILDGAQNVASVKALLSSIKNIFSYRRLVCIFGISSDKDIQGVARELDRASDIVILTRSSASRAMPPVYLKAYFSRSDIWITGSVEEALKRGIGIADKEDLVLVTGSLYVVGEALSLRETGQAKEDRLRPCPGVRARNLA